MSDYSIYPRSLDGYSQLPVAIDNVTEIDARSINRLRSAIVNVQSELGVMPSGGNRNLSERLRQLDEAIETIQEDIDLIKNLEIFSSKVNPVVVSTNYVIKSTDTHILVKNINSQITITLPNTNEHISNNIVIKDKGDSETYNIVILPQDNNTIDGNEFVILDINYSSLSLIFDPSDNDWSIV
jgi:hypothetical protein